MQKSECGNSDCPRYNTNYDGPFYFPHDKTKVRFMVVTEQYPPEKRFDKDGRKKSLQDIENALIDQCKKMIGKA